MKKKTDDKPKVVPMKAIEGGKNGGVELPNAYFKNDHFKTAFSKLISSEVGFKTFYTIKRISDKLEQQAKNVINPEEKRIRESFLVDEVVKGADGKESTVKKWGDEAGANEAFKELYSATFAIEVKKIPAADLEHLRFSANEWDALSPLIEM